MAHYLIHLYDYPPIAEKGLEAARRYAKIAPAAPHAQHMPSHIFTRVGFWKESIASNTDSARSAKDGKDFDEQLHAMDYMVYAYLQLGQDKKAGAIVDEMSGVTGINPGRFVSPYALAVSPARYMIERGDWKSAAELNVRPSQFAYADAMTHFARALGAARSGNPEAAKADIAKIGELREAKDAYWSGQVDIQAQVASAWVLFAEGKHDDALKAMSAAADAEDKTEKHPVTPGVPKPARELYGAMLLERGMAKEALAAFEATLKKEPNRLGAYVGAAKAAERSGDKAKARAYYQKIVAIAGGADKSRVEVAEARTYLKRRCEARNDRHGSNALRAVVLPIVLAALAAPAGAQSLQVFGYAGVLGEWELTATVTEKAFGRAREFVGPLTMKHVGVCTRDGPEVKSGEIRFQRSAWSSRLKATLSVAGVECTYSGRLSDSYTGMMTCPKTTGSPDALAEIAVRSTAAIAASAPGYRAPLLSASFRGMAAVERRSVYPRNSS